jgi:hypothetical protein
MQEAEFKAKKIRRWKDEGAYDKIFCIETEETLPGFPDTMARVEAKVLPDIWHFYEFKVSDKKGVIKFERSQPMFYRKHPDLGVRVIALDNRTGTEVLFHVEELFDMESRHYMNMKLEVQL